VAEDDHEILKAYAAHNQRTIAAELHHLIIDGSRCRLDTHKEKIKKLEAQLDQVIALAREYKKRYGPSRAAIPELQLNLPIFIDMS
jgi:hypothetical protein